MDNNNIKILVIDDDPILVRLVQSSLEASGFSVIAALDGEEGLEKFKEENPCLIILDIKMPRMDGYTFVLEFKKIADLKTTPIIILTAYEEMREIFLIEGINDYLVKPFNAPVLLKKIHKHLESPTKKILVVEDEADVTQILQTRFTTSSYEVLSAKDGMEGLYKARTHKPDLIVLDVMLPKLNGFSVCRLLKFDEKYRSIPIIIHSDRGEEINQEISRQVGADAYFTKPCSGEVLLGKMKELLWD